ncbi:hypothetical protein OG788_44425 [Streptomyces sp. NBC_00647]
MGVYEDRGQQIALVHVPHCHRALLQSGTPTTGAVRVVVPASDDFPAR